MVASRLPPDADRVARAWAELLARDPSLKPLDAVPALPWRTLPSGFPGLLRLIVGQQVSTTSADACWARLEAAVGPVLPATIATLDPQVLRAAGFSSQKAAYARALADAHGEGGFAPLAIAEADDATAAAALVALKGVGRWTAQTYLMMCEGRLDAWPGGDIALQEAIRWIDALDARPGEAAADARAEAWRPYRAVAAHRLWAYYLAVKAGEIARPNPVRETL